MSDRDVIERTWPTEAEVADLLPIECATATARRVLEEVPFWFHTFALNREEGIYTPGVARDHGYHFPFFPDDFSGQRVLDVGCFDGFYAYLAEARGAERVLAVDSEQYLDWAKARWDAPLEGGEGVGAIGRLLESRVEYRRMDALDLAQVDEKFDVIICFGLLHRVENPLGLLRLLRSKLDGGGRLLLETHGLDGEVSRSSDLVGVPAPGGVYRGDNYVYWCFGGGAVVNLAAFAGYADAELAGTPTVDGHPRLLATLAEE